MGGAFGDLDANIVDNGGGDDAEPVGDERVIGGEAVALGGAVGKVVGALDFADGAAAGEGVAGREGVAFVELVIELEGEFGAAGAGGVEPAVI